MERDAVAGVQAEMLAGKQPGVELDRRSARVIQDSAQSFFILKLVNCRTLDGA